MALKYAALSKELTERIQEDRRRGAVNPYRTDDGDVIRRDPDHDKANLWRPAFVRDAEKILHLPAYNRYADKTQVFSFYRNDDITRRALHVQLVSRIARNIGAVLGLNLDLIEAIALGHDIGHTPFGHAGERYLSEILEERTGCAFNHNVHSVRVLDVIYKRNISLQTLDGILCHNGEFELKRYAPEPLAGFEEFDRKFEGCYTGGKAAIDALIPATLEGCVVRLSDIIAYLGKDRQDARLARIIDEDTSFSKTGIGYANADMINNLIVDIIEHSYGKDCISLSEQAYEGLKTAKSENYRFIYNNPAISDKYEHTVRPMFRQTFERILDDLTSGDDGTFVHRHHIGHIEQYVKFYGGAGYAENESAEFIAADYIASMTDDYFIDLYERLFPDSEHRIEYVSYFEEDE